MTEVTLIGENIAKEGLEFAFGGCLSRCQSCELKNSCCGLKKNKWYRIIGVRDNLHDCKVHNGKVKVVEVEEIPLKTTLEGRTSIEGSVVTLDKKDCSNLECEQYALCHPPGIEFGGKYTLEKVGKKIDCPKGYNLKEVELV